MNAVTNLAKHHLLSQVKERLDDTSEALPRMDPENPEWNGLFMLSLMDPGPEGLCIRLLRETHQKDGAIALLKDGALYHHPDVLNTVLDMVIDQSQANEIHEVRVAVLGTAVRRMASDGHMRELREMGRTVGALRVFDSLLERWGADVWRQCDETGQEMGAFTVVADTMFQEAYEQMEYGKEPPAKVQTNIRWLTQRLLQRVMDQGKDPTLAPHSDHQDPMVRMTKCCHGPYLTSALPVMEALLDMELPWREALLIAESDARAIIEAHPKVKSDLLLDVAKVLPGSGRAPRI